MAVEEKLKEILLPSHEIGIDVNHVGSCVLLAVREENSIVVANAGDCRAVLGRVDASVGEEEIIEVGGKGVMFPFFNGFPSNSTPFSYPANVIFNAIQITNDHNSKMAVEKERLAREHPNEENIVVCKRPDSCYVKGRLQPTRAIGDLYLKFDEFNALPPDEHHLKTRGRHIPAPYTPPYVMTRPEVHSLTLQPKRDAFLILATDGVWDFLSCQEAVDAVGEAIKEGKGGEASKRVVLATLKKAALEADISLQELTELPKHTRRKIFDDTTATVLFL